MAEEQALELNPQQQLWVEEYLTCWNATRAAIRAGYSEESAAKQGYRMSRNVHVQALIRKRLAGVAMGADEVLARIGEHARADMSDFVDVTEERQWLPNLKKAESFGKLHLIQEIGYTEHGPKIKLVDAQSALTLLARHHGLLNDKLKVESDPFAGWTDEEIDEYARTGRRPVPGGSAAPGRSTEGAGEAES